MGESRKIQDLSDYELDIAVKQMADTIAEDASDPDEARELAELVREQYQRQRRAKLRIGEYLRQRDLRNKSYWMRDKEPKNVIDRVHEDRHAKSIDLLYSDIEALAPWAEKDTATPFWAEQLRRLEAVIAANPKLTEKQKATLEQIATKERRVGYSAKYGASYGALDGRTVNGLEKRGLITTWTYGTGYGREGFLIIAEVQEP